VYFVGQHIKAGAYFYFIQDFEKLFYPAGTEYHLADQTYEFGYLGVFNTPGLMQAILSEHEMRGIAFRPGVDEAVFYPSTHPNSIQNYPIRIVFYGRPGVPRNMFELGIGVLRVLKQKFGDKLEIIVVGSPDGAVSLGFEAKWLGYLPYTETGKLYRSAHIGLALMATPHPSYLPFQLMACGTVLVCLDSTYTAWLLKDGINSICAGPSIADIVQRIAHAVADVERFDEARRQAIATARQFSWAHAVETTLDRMVGIVPLDSSIAVLSQSP
jgi:glycosyltransferase involved in cell wall biosynthesis